MRKKQHAGEPVVDTGLAVDLHGDGLALGTDTLTNLVTHSVVIDTGNKIMAQGSITVVSLAESEPGGSTFADAQTFASIFGADTLRIKTVTETFQVDGVSYAISTTTFKAIDYKYANFTDQVIVEKDIQYVDEQKITTNHTNILYDICGVSYDRELTTTQVGGNFDYDCIQQLGHIDGNFAYETIDAQAVGENTLVDATVFNLAIEDTLSQSQASIFSAVDYLMS